MKSISKMFKALLGGCAALFVLYTLASQAAAQTWVELAPTGGPPPIRHAHAAFYDPDTNRMVVFGGQNGPGTLVFDPLLNDVWVLENANGQGGTPNWVQLFPTGGPPSTRFVHTGVYDAATNRMIVFGGIRACCSIFVNDVWVLVNANGQGGTPNWVELFPTGGPPPARGSHTGVYDAATNRMIVFGGSDNAAFKNDVWILEHANGQGGTPNWVQLFPTGGSPSARGAHTAVYDPITNRMIVFGGTGLNDVWVLEHANGQGGTPNWVELFPTGGPPDGRSGHGAVYDATTDRMTVFGGATTVGRDNDVWVLENASGVGGTPNWVEIFPTGGPPSERVDAYPVYNAATNRMILFAGTTDTPTCCSALNDAWVLTDANGIVEPATITVSIDIKPGSFPNSINPRSRGVIPVAILSTDSFDATTVDPTTVLFGATGTEAAPVHSALEDVDGDGDTDMILHFNTQDTGIVCGDTFASLTGETFDGQMIEGSDSIKTVGCK